MPVRCYGQSWYKYRIRIGAHVLFCRNLRDRIVDRECWSDSYTDGLKPTCLLHRWTKPTHQTKNLGGNLTRFSNRYRYRYRFSKH